MAAEANNVTSRQEHGTPKLLNLDRALDVMERYALDALVVTTPENVLYVSDYALEWPFHTIRDFNAAILPRDRSLPPVLFVQELQLPALVQAPTWMPEIRVQTSGYTAISNTHDLSRVDQQLRELIVAGRSSGDPDRWELIRKTLVELGLEKAALGVDDLYAIAELTDRVPDARLKRADNTLREIRIVKTLEEIRRLSDAARLVEAALGSVSNLLREGVTCREIISCYRTTMAVQGGYGSHITYGGGSQPWLGFEDLSYRLKSRDVIYVDPAGEYRHYWSDIGRAAQIGQEDAKFQERFGVLQDCHRAVVPTLVPGESFSSVTDRARDVVRPAMPEGLFALAHSIGIEQYDHPQTSGAFGGGDLVLEPEMVINFETGYLELGWGVIHLEDTYRITPHGPERLTTLPLAPLRATGAVNRSATDQSDVSPSGHGS